MRQTNEMRPLAGIRVIEAASYISGPFAGLILADLGAEVIKVEPPRGDPLRRLEELGRPPVTHDDVARRADVLGLYQEIVDALNRELAQFERVKKIAILPAEFSVESGELTPTLKVKRKVVAERYREAIERIYRDE